MLTCFRPIPLIVALLLGPAGWGEAARADSTTLRELCGPKTLYKGAGDNSSQFDSTCRAAYVNGDGMVANDNNARVLAAGAVVCGFSCLSGLPSVCAGGCSQAVQTGKHAYAADQQSTSNQEAVQANGWMAWSIKSTAPTVAEKLAQVSPSAGGNTTFGLGGVPDSCVRAGKSGSLGDRIACSVSSDPSMPGFVRDPRFAAEFQSITGTSLQSALNMPAGQVALMLPGALKTAYGKVSGKMSFAEFLKRSADIVKAVSAALPEGERKGFLAAVMGSAGKGSGEAATALASLGGPAEKSAESTAPMGEGTMQASSSFSHGEGNWTEDDVNVSLFERVSFRYRLYSPYLQKVSITE